MKTIWKVKQMISYRSLQSLKKNRKALGLNQEQNGYEGAAVSSPGPWLRLYRYFVKFNIIVYKLSIIVTFQIAFWCINKLNIGFGIK